MDWFLIVIQLLNGLQLGVLLFLLAAGLTLVFGIMNFVNLAHGSLYMMGAYFAATLYDLSQSFWIAALGAVAGSFLLGVLVKQVALWGLFDRDHLDQVLATFGLILFFNELARMIWGSSPYYMTVPPAFSGFVEFAGITYPIYRLLIIGVGLSVAGGAWFLIQKTRVGMLIRAGASIGWMVGALGVNIKLLNTLLFGLGAALAGLAGLMVGPILSVQVGMGEPTLILTLVTIVIGGIGSIRGAFLGAVIVGTVDTLGRTMLPLLLRQFLESTVANAAGPAIASMLIYLLMAGVLAVKPEGLFPVKHG
jgi:branched-chain amino acid transport system permease protein